MHKIYESTEGGLSTKITAGDAIREKVQKR